MSVPRDKVPPKVRKRELSKLHDDIMAAVTEDWIVCLECGAMFTELGTHVTRRHGITSAEYKEHWGYNRNYGLTCGSRKRRKREVMVEVVRKKGIEIWRERARRAGAVATRGTGLEEGHRPQALAKIRAERASRKIDGKRVARLFAKGHSQREIARRMNRSATAVHQHLKEAGLITFDPKRTKPRTPENELVELLRKGLSPEGIAARLGIRPEVLRRRILRLMERRGWKEIDSPKLRRLRRTPKRALHDDHIICLVCGSQTRSLVEHLRGHKLTLQEYRGRYRLKVGDLS